MVFHASEYNFQIRFKMSWKQIFRLHPETMMLISWSRRMFVIL